jgi:hypothetical protein
MKTTLSLTTTDKQTTKFDIIVVSWVHTTPDERYIEISAQNSSLGQLLVTINSPRTIEFQRRLSEFHDKLLFAMKNYDTQITAYTGTDTIPPDLLTIDLIKQFVYLIVVL